MGRVLVVDDSTELLEMVRLLLEERGRHEAVLCTNGEDALAEAFATPPDLAILDVMMPGMTGYEVCRKLRGVPATADVPIIILTARGQDVDRVTAMEAGADLYMAKPVTMEELLENVERLISGSARQPSRPAGKTLAFLSLRGGVGVTTLAVNTAAALARRTEGVCLVDLCLSSGNAALQLGLRPEPNWMSLASPGGKLDPAVPESWLLSHTTGLHLLAAPFVPVLDEALSATAIRTALTALRERFGILVLDLPSVLSDTTMLAVEWADVLGLVLTFDPASIQAALGTLQALKSHAKRIRLILNQVVPSQAPPVQALERVLRRPLSAVVPYDASQSQALNRGQPLALSAPASRLSRAVSGLLAALRPALIQRPGT